ncbi:MAG: exodeoxyribonuclease III [bacterium]
MKLATWNVNSIRSRLDRLLAWLSAHGPDVLCLQEIKLVDELFPLDAIRAAGYHAAVFGQKTYNGVAILARAEPTVIARGFGDGVDDPQARFLDARIGEIRVLNCYVPNGSEVGSEKWRYKLAWLERLAGYLAAHCDVQEPLVLCGDMNVAPEARDVHDPALWEPTVLFHPEARAALAQVTAWGLEDVFRRHRAEAGLFSWWDYRQLAFPKNQGLRIDHVFATAPLAARSTEAAIDREQRKGQQPSDHAPVIVSFR